MKTPYQISAFLCLALLPGCQQVDPPVRQGAVPLENVVQRAGEPAPDVAAAVPVRQDAVPSAPSCCAGAEATPERGLNPTQTTKPSAP